MLPGTAGLTKIVLTLSFFVDAVVLDERAYANKGREHALSSRLLFLLPFPLAVIAAFRRVSAIIWSADSRFRTIRGESTHTYLFLVHSLPKINFV